MTVANAGTEISTNFYPINEMDGTKFGFEQTAEQDTRRPEATHPNRTKCCRRRSLAALRDTRSNRRNIVVHCSKSTITPEGDESSSGGRSEAFTTCLKRETSTGLAACAVRQDEQRSQGTKLARPRFGRRQLVVTAIQTSKNMRESSQKARQLARSESVAKTHSTTDGRSGQLDA